MEHITLYYREGASDKVYQASLQPHPDGGYVVHFAYGRRGSTLNTGIKTPQPLAYDEARRVLDQLVRAKTAKGYTPGSEGTPFQHHPDAGRTTGLRPQLLNPVDPVQAARLLQDPAWALQEKFDGRRLLLQLAVDGVRAVNRQGLVVSTPEPVRAAAAALPTCCVLDGECVGERFIAFDLLELEDTDLRPMPCHGRLFQLAMLVGEGSAALSQAVTATTTAFKAQLMQRLRRENKEGAVFKRLHAPYVPGRPASGGDALKLKFHETASFIVAEVNVKRSIRLELFNEDARRVPAGNVTIPPNHPVPPPGEVVEVRYLYAFRESGCLYQPVYLGPRDDLEPGNCTTPQLKFRPQAEVALATA